MKIQMTRLLRALLRLGRRIMPRMPRFHMPSPATVVDLHVYGGLVVALVGGAFISWPWALVAFGIALASLGLYVSRRHKPEGSSE